MVKTKEFLPRTPAIYMANDMSSVLSEDELAEIKWAYDHLEHPSLGARLSAVLATPIEEGLKLLPKTWQGNLDKIRIIGHSMKGAGGGYGFDEVTRLGDLLEQAATVEDRAAIGEVTEELADYLQRVEVVYE